MALGIASEETWYLAPGESDSVGTDMDAKTVIVGCGISGIGCARRLAQAGEDFLVLTQDVGGRVLPSADGRYNYGALFLLDDYHHVKQLSTLRRRVPRHRIEFHWRGREYFIGRMLRHPLQLRRLVRRARWFRAHYEAFKRRVPVLGQKAALEADEALWATCLMSADAYIEREGLAEIGREFVGEALYFCAFSPLTDVSAFDFLRVCVGMLRPAYEYSLDLAQAVAPFRHRIVRDTVVEIRGDRRVRTAGGTTYDPRHVVVATPVDVSRTLLGVPVRRPKRCTILHVRGTRKTRWARGEWEAFDSSSPVIGIYRLADGTYLVGSVEPRIRLERYFAQHEVLFKRCWDPAFHVGLGDFVDPVRGDGIYCVGELNLTGLEDCYLNGLWAAERILRSAG